MLAMTNPNLVIKSCKWRNKTLDDECGTCHRDHWGTYISRSFEIITNSCKIVTKNNETATKAKSQVKKINKKSNIQSNKEKSNIKKSNNKKRSKKIHNLHYFKIQNIKDYAFYCTIKQNIQQHLCESNHCKPYKHKTKPLICSTCPLL